MSSYFQMELKGTLDFENNTLVSDALKEWFKDVKEDKDEVNYFKFNKDVFLDDSGLNPIIIELHNLSNEITITTEDYLNKLKYLTNTIGCEKQSIDFTEDNKVILDIKIGYKNCIDMFDIFFLLLEPYMEKGFEVSINLDDDAYFDFKKEKDFSTSNFIIDSTLNEIINSDKTYYIPRIMEKYYGFKYKRSE